MDYKLQMFSLTSVHFHDDTQKMRLSNLKNRFNVSTRTLHMLSTIKNIKDNTKHTCTHKKLFLLHPIKLALF